MSFGKTIEEFRARHDEMGREEYARLAVAYFRRRRRKKTLSAQSVYLYEKRQRNPRQKMRKLLEKFMQTYDTLHPAVQPETNPSTTITP